MRSRRFARTRRTCLQTGDPHCCVIVCIDMLFVLFFAGDGGCWVTLRPTAISHSTWTCGCWRIYFPCLWAWRSCGSLLQDYPVFNSSNADAGLENLWWEDNGSQCETLINKGLNNWTRLMIVLGRNGLVDRSGLVYFACVTLATEDISPVEEHSPTNQHGKITLNSCKCFYRTVLQNWQAPGLYS